MDGVLPLAGRLILRWFLFRPVPCHGFGGLADRRSDFRDFFFDVLRGASQSTCEIVYGKTLLLVASL